MCGFATVTGLEYDILRNIIFRQGRWCIEEKRRSGCFIVIGDGETEVLAYIDCLVFPPDGGSGPIFRAVRNGRLKDQALPGEPRIMRSLMQALQKSVQIARV